jgi:hypothetical protein
MGIKMQILETQPFLLDIHSITLRITHEEFEKLCLDRPGQKLGDNLIKSNG